MEGGHAVVAVGYDDKKEIRNAYTDKPTAGALLIRNSWGKGWGDSGYGWLPYEYVNRGLAEDFWSVLKKEWVDTGEFRIWPILRHEGERRAAAAASGSSSSIAAFSST